MLKGKCHHKNGDETYCWREGAVKAGLMEGGEEDFCEKHAPGYLGSDAAYGLRIFLGSLAGLARLALLRASRLAPLFQPREGVGHV